MSKAHTTTTSTDEHSYWSASRSALYGATALIPLMVLYEIGTLAVDAFTTHRGMRNAADVWLKQLLTLVGVGSEASVLAVLVLLIWAVVFGREWRRLRRVPQIRGSYLGLMLLESLAYGFLLGGAASWLTVRFFGLMPGWSIESLALISGQGRSLLAELVISVGAGLYEELVFRLFLISLLSVVFESLYGKGVHLLPSLIFSSIIFAGSHYIGVYGDPLQLTSFVFRVMAGMLLGCLYLYRGIGIACYSHAFYDIQYFLFLR